MKRTESLRGFTLLEIAIVMVIIAVIIGSVAITQSLIRDAQVRSIIGESQRYIQAIGDFQSKYQAFPGDFARATTIWGAAALCPTTANNGTTVTCNGDGNGRIATQGTATTYYEEFRAWQHLMNARMVEGSVTGVANTSTTHGKTPGTNIPLSKLTGAGWALTSVLPTEAAVTVTEIPYFTGDIPPNHVLWFGGATFNSEATNRQDPVLKVTEASTLDLKIDDGKPNTGKVIVQFFSAAGVCTASGGCPCAVDTTITAEYNYSLGGSIICTLVFKTGF